MTSPLKIFFSVFGSVMSGIILFFIISSFNDRTEIKIQITGMCTKVDDISEKIQRKHLDDVSINDKLQEIDIRFETVATKEEIKELATIEHVKEIKALIYWLHAEAKHNNNPNDLTYESNDTN